MLEIFDLENRKHEKVVWMKKMVLLKHDRLVGHLEKQANSGNSNCSQWIIHPVLLEHNDPRMQN